MLKYIFTILLITACACVHSQVIYPYQDIKLEKPSDYIETEPVALSASIYLITTPFAEENENRTKALSFLLLWMEGAKGFNFYMQGVVPRINTDRNLVHLYIAAMAKYSLEHKAEAPISLIVEKNACKMVLAYCDNPANNFKLKKKLRKYLETD